MRVLVTKLQKVERVAFAPEGMHLFASGLHTGSLGYGAPDTGIDVFDLAADPEPAARLFADQFIHWFAPLSSGRVAASRYTDLGGSGPSDGPTLGVIDWHSGREDRATLDGWKMWHPAAVGPHGRLISVLISTQANRTGGPIAFERGAGCWRLPNTGEPQADWHLGLGNDRHVFAIAFAPDGRSFWTAEWIRSEVAHRWHMELVPRDAASGNPLRAAIPYPNQKIADLALSDTVAVAHDGPSLFVYDLANLDRKPKKVTNPAQRKHFAGFAIHPSGRWLTTAGLGGAVTLWDTATWTVARTWAWNAGRARSVCFNADGTLAAAGTDSGEIVVWDLDV